jgi:hypothetical protein
MVSSSNRLLNVVPQREYLVLLAARRRTGSWSGSLLSSILREVAHPNDVVLLLDGPVAKGRVVADGGCILGRAGSLAG